MRIGELVTPNEDSPAAPPPARAPQPQSAAPTTSPSQPDNRPKQGIQHLSGVDPKADAAANRAFAHQPVHFGAYRSYHGPPPPQQQQHQQPQQSPTHHQQHPPHYQPHYTFQATQQPPTHVMQFQHQHLPSASPVIRRRRPQSSRSIDSPDSPAHVAKSPTSADAAAMQPPQNASVPVVPGNRSFPCPLSIYGCTSTFGSKNEWKRHVNTQHMRMGFWRCDMCKNGDRKPNDFNRKDLFIQHVRRMHPMSATSAATAGLPAPSKSSKDGEDMQALQTAATRCYKALRHPPQGSRCLFCERTFTGDGTWDDRMEHVGRHLELMRRANEQPPEQKDWKHDDDMEKWMINYRIIVPNGDSLVLDDQQLAQKPPRRASSISTIPRQPVQPTPPQIRAQPPTAGHILPAPNGRLSSPDRLFSAFDEPAETPAKPEPPQQPDSSAGTSPGTTADSHPHTNGTQETTATEVTVPITAPITTTVKTNVKPEVKADPKPEVEAEPKVKTRSKAKRVSTAEAEQAEGGAAEEDDPYLSLFQTIPKRKKGTAAGDDDDDEEAEPEFLEDSRIAGGSQRTSRKRQASPARSTHSFCGSLKDRIYSGFQKAVMGMATSVQRLFVEPQEGQLAVNGADGAALRTGTPVAKRTRTARAQEKSMIDGEDDEEVEKPVRKRARRGAKEREDSAARDSSVSSLSMSTRSSGRVKDSRVEKGVISSRS